MLTQPELNDVIDRHYRNPGDRLFRLETLPEYRDNDATTRRWLAGETQPHYSSAWCQHLTDENANGLIQERVVILPADLTDDRRAACLIGYPATSRAGERISVLRVGEHSIPVPAWAVDYWLVEPVTGPTVVILMRYHGGVFLGAELVESIGDRVKFRHDRDQLLAHAEPFEQWRARHLADLAPPARRVA